MWRWGPHRQTWPTRRPGIGSANPPIEGNQHLDAAIGKRFHSPREINFHGGEQGRSVPGRNEFVQAAHQARPRPLVSRRAFETRRRSPGDGVVTGDASIGSTDGRGRFHDGEAGIRPGGGGVGEGNRGLLGATPTTVGPLTGDWQGVPDRKFAKSDLPDLVP